MKKYLASFGFALILSGCASVQDAAHLQNEVNALKAEVEMNHKDMHTEDKKLADSFRVIIERLNSHVDWLQLQKVQLDELENFKAEHDKRWPSLKAKEKK